VVNWATASHLATFFQGGNSEEKNGSSMVELEPKYWALEGGGV